MTTTPRFSIALDPTALDASSDDTIIDAFLTLARDADATFTDVRIADDDDDVARFAHDVTVTFAATLSDVARYARAYDAYDAITSL